MPRQPTKRDITARHGAQVLAINEDVRLPISQIRQDGGTQMRAMLRAETVTEYQENMQDAGGWGTFPKVGVVYDGSAYWLWDGFHRLGAALLAFGPDYAVPVDVTPGDQLAAILLAAKANDTHGLRRNNADKQRAVRNILAMSQFQDKGDPVIAEICAVSARFVGKVRGEMVQAGAVPSVTHRQGRDGRTINTEKIGRVPPPRPVQPDNSALLEGQEYAAAKTFNAPATGFSPVVVASAKAADANPAPVVIFPRDPEGVVVFQDGPIVSDVDGRPGELLTPILRRGTCAILYEALATGLFKNLLTPAQVSEAMKAVNRVLNQGVRT